MLELMIDTWSHPQTGTTYRWSLWQDGKRLAMGGPHASAEESRDEALAVCAQHLKRPPDRVTQL